MIKSDLIYDVGMNNGDDSQYYLRKGFRVVGIDADSDSCQSCMERFAEDIKSGRMTVLYTGIGLVEGQNPFYVNTRETPISSFMRPETLGSDWVEKTVNVVRLSSIIASLGLPHYIKIDVEHYDNMVLQDLKETQIFPHYISAEAHNIDVLDTIVSMGYSRFKLISGASVHDLYVDHNISTLNASQTKYSFPALSSGPFGDDIPGPWYGAKEIREKLLGVGLGWIDVHACIF